jgi:hypothetical protein
MKRILEDDDTFSEKPSDVAPQSLGKFSDSVLPFFRPETSDEEKGKILHKALTKFGHVGFRCDSYLQLFGLFKC